jgi:Ca2+-transporting ATPase
VEKQIHVLGNGDLPLGDRTNMVYMGTSVSAGRGLAVVVATGMSTEIDRIASLLQEAETGETTPLQQSLAVFGRFLVWITLGVVALSSISSSLPCLLRSPRCRKVCRRW